MGDRRADSGHRNRYLRNAASACEVDREKERRRACQRALFTAGR